MPVCSYIMPPTVLILKEYISKRDLTTSHQLMGSIWSAPVTLTPHRQMPVREVQTITNIRRRNGQLCGRDRKSPPSGPSQVTTLNKQHSDRIQAINQGKINITQYRDYLIALMVNIGISEQQELGDEQVTDLSQSFGKYYHIYIYTIN